MNKTFEYALSFSDPEGCSVVMSTAPSSLSSFVSVSGNKIIFAPTLSSQIGKYSITVDLTDLSGLITSSIFDSTVFVYPILNANVTQNFQLLASQNISYNLPVIAGIADEFVIHPNGLPRFVNFNFPNYTFYPNLVSDLGIY
jgi:hypothetical protein